MLIDEWYSLNQLSLDLNKCTIVSFRKRLSLVKFNYTAKSQVLARKDKIKDLGMIFDGALNFTELICVQLHLGLWVSL